MNTPPNLFKKSLVAGTTQIGLWLGLANAYAAELCATADFDWLVIDGEHAPNDPQSTLAALQAVAPYPVRPVVRISDGDPTLIKKVLELGAQTLLVPMVEDAAQARELVRAMRYPPAGIRGVGSGLARSSRWNHYNNYLRDANEQVCLLVQVETASALEQLPEIAGVDGVDGIFIGPADLAASMGYIGNSAHPEVTGAIDAAIATIGHAGKPAGILCTDESLARHYIKQGVRFAAVGVDTSLLANAARTLAAKFKQR